MNKTTILCAVINCEKIKACTIFRIITSSQIKVATLVKAWLSQGRKARNANNPDVLKSQFMPARGICASSLFVCAATILASTTLVSAAVVAQNDAARVTEYQVGRSTTQPGEERHGQTFTASFSGQLTTLDIMMRQVFGGQPTVPNQVQVSVYNTSGGLPTGPALGMQIIPFADLGFGINTYYSFDFTSDAIDLVASTQYAFMVGVDVNNGSQSLEPMGVTMSDFSTDEVYTGGSAVHDFGGGPFTTTGDVVFTASAIPEPSALGLLGLSGLLLIRRRRR